MTLKLLGGLILLCAGGQTAWNLRTYEKRRVSVLDGWLDLLFYIRTSIDCYLTPVEDIFAEADPTLLRACMGDGTVKSPTDLLSCSLPYLDEEAKRLLESFSREIGNCYREEQVKRCDYYLSALRAIREKKTAELPARLRVRSALCLCSAVGLAILLW